MENGVELKKEKKCPNCGIVKFLSEFHLHKNRFDGHGVWCKACQKKYGKKYYKKHKEKRRNNELKNNYGTTLAQYEEMLEKQGGVCVLCGNTSLKGRCLSVDHNHITRKVRGLLCYRCNTSIGQIAETPEMLKRLIEYLEREDK